MKKTLGIFLALLLAAPAFLPASGADQWRAYGAKLSQAGRPAEALKAYGQALRYDRRDAAAWAGAGNARWALGQKELAVASWRESLRLNPANQPLADYVAKVGMLPEPKPAQAAARQLPEAGKSDWMGHGMKGVFLALGLAVVAIF